MNDQLGDSPFEATLPAPPKYCVQCQAELPADEGPTDCPDCHAPFDPADSATYLSFRVVSTWRYWFPGFCLAVVSGVLSYAICLLSGELGFALFVAVPVSIGAILGYGTRAGAILLALLGFAAVGSVVFALVAMHWAGFFCGLMLALIFLGPVCLGAVFGLALRKMLWRTKWDQRWFLPLVAFVLLPYVVQWIENQIPNRTEIATVRTELTVDATPAEAWRAIMFYEEVEHEPPWLLRLALPRPVRSVGAKDKVGDVVRCYYDRGHLSKRISEVEPRWRLAFEVIEQHLHFERDVTLRGGSFEIHELGPNSCQIRLTTSYQRHLRPVWMWEPVERQVVSTLHRHVLQGMQLHIEACRLPGLMAVTSSAPKEP